MLLNDEASEHYEFRNQIIGKAEEFFQKEKEFQTNP